MKVARIGTTNITIHWLAIIIIFILIALGHWKTTLLISAIVLIHEIAHTIVAKIYRYNVSEIELFPFGGIAKIDGIMGSNPESEINIAIAGPVINFILAAIALSFGEVRDLTTTRGMFIGINLSIAFFNLMPIIPLDGGRIIRSYISKKTGIKSASRIIYYISNFFALLLALLGIYLIVLDIDKIRGLFFVLLTIFLYFASLKEKKMSSYLFIKDINERKDLLYKKGVLKSNYLVSTEHTSLGEVINQFIPSNYHIIAVINSKGQVVGSVTEEDITKAILNYGLSTPISVLLYNRKKW